MNEQDRLQESLSERYRIESVIGRGGMSTVYLAHDLKHDRRVAIKILRPELVSMVGIERFLREIRIEACLEHVNILPLYDSGEAGGFVYFVMRYVDGESLRDRLDREKQLSIDEAARITGEIAEALGYAHCRGIVHRDVKPENILLSDGHAVLADFGIARAIDVAGGKRVTDSGYSVGTPAYMSPEQAAGEADLDGRTDIYSLACVLYEMLGGEPPFTGSSVKSIIAKHMLEPPPSIETLRPTVPACMRAAINAGLAKTPADRFQSTDEFMAAIDSSARGERAEDRGQRSVREVPQSEYNSSIPEPTRFFIEARRRYLPQVGLVYLVFAWVAGDSAVRLARSGVVGTWLLPAVFTLLIAGLPLVLAVVWIQKPASGEAAKRRRTWRRWLGTIRAGHLMSLLAVLAFAILLAVKGGDNRDGPPPPPPATRIAVLRFEDASPSQEFGYLATGIPEYLTQKLSQLDAFDVVPYHAVRRYSPDTPLDSIAGAFGAGTIIEGFVIGSDREVRVPVSLTDVTDPSKMALLHSTEYRERRGEPLALLDTLTNDVARSLRLALGVVARDLERREGTNSDEAWEHYAHGREWATNAEELRQAGGPERALQAYARADSAFHRAQLIDPNWVDPIVERGWVRLKESQIRKPNLRTRDPELLRQAIGLTEDALEIDSLSARALDLHGTLLYWLGEVSSDAEARRLRAGAERDLLAATELDPRDAHAWHRLSNVFRAQGRYLDAKRAAERALEADEYYDEREDIFKQLCLTSIDNREWAQVTRWCEKGRHEFPHSAYILNAELAALASPGGPQPDVDKAWQLRDGFVEASPPDERATRRPSVTFYVAAVLARAKLPDSARAVIQQARDASTKPQAMDDYNEANVRLLLGEKEEALRLLERYVDAKPSAKETLGTDWWFESLLSEPRFQKLIKQEQ